MNGGAVRLARLALFLAFAPCAARAQESVEAFYAGKTLRLVVGYPAGTVFDAYSRLTLRHMTKHVPGKPQGIVQNMPGAGGLNAIVSVVHVSPADGLSMAMASPGYSVDTLLDPANAKFDGRRVNWIGSVSSETGACAFWRGKGRTIEAMRAGELVLGGTGPASSTYFEPRTLETLFGFRFRYVHGYPSTVDIRLAAEKGEVDGLCGLAASTIVRDMAEPRKSGAISVPLQAGLAPNPDLDAPNAMDLAKSEDERQIMTLVFGPSAWFRPLVTAEGVPSGRVAALRAAFDATMKDPEFLAEMARGKLDARPMGGAEMAARIAEIYRTPAPVVERTRRILGLAP